jgi:hypothetical protein
LERLRNRVEELEAKQAAGPSHLVVEKERIKREPMVIDLT